MISDAGAFVLPFFPADSTHIDRIFQFAVFILYSFDVQILWHPAGHTARQAQRALQNVFNIQTGTNTAKGKNRLQGFLLAFPAMHYYYYTVLIFKICAASSTAGNVKLEYT